MKKITSGQRKCQRKVVKHTDEQKSARNQKVEEWSEILATSQSISGQD